MTKAKPRVASRTLRARAAQATLVDVVEILGVSRETVRQWHLAGCPRRSDGTFAIAEVVSWLRKRDREALLAEAQRDAGGRKTVDRKLEAEAQLKELQVAQMRGELVRRETLDETVRRVIGGFSAVASGRLGRFEREWIRCTTPGEARKIADRVHAALMEGTQELAGELEDEAGDDDASEADAIAESA